MPRKIRETRAKSVEALKHEEATRRNLPSAEHQPLMREEEQSPVRLAYERRNRDLDPQLVWRGKDEQDWSDLVVNAPPLYIQERVHAKALIDDLRRSGQWSVASGQGGDRSPTTDHWQLDLFADFNGLPSEDARTEFYQHDANWSNAHGPGRQPSGYGVPGREGGAAGQGAVHLHRPALRHPFQLQLPVVHHQPGRARRQPRAHHPRAGAGRSRPSATPGATASTPT